MSDKTKTISKTYESCELPASLREWIDYWVEEYNEIPEEYRDTTTVELEVVEGYCGAEFEIKVSYIRPYTQEEEEEANLIAKEKVESTVKKEYEMYLKLKGIYER